MSVRLRVLQSRPGARMRLICAPHAGAGIMPFGRWPSCLPASIEVAALQLPAREDRLSEPPLTSWEVLITDAVRLIGDLPSLPIALFGHSFGALIAFEVARSIARVGSVSVAALIVSGRSWPGSAQRREPISHLPDQEFITELDRRYGALSSSLAHPEILALALPPLRADVRLLEAYRYQSMPPLRVPITAYAGESDPSIRAAEIHGWRHETDDAFRSVMFPGGHFFIDSARESVLADVMQTLEYANLARGLCEVPSS